MTDVLELRAGPVALQRIRKEGLQASMIRGIAGAAGGPKWLVLDHLDRFLFSHWLPRQGRPRFLLGSSIAAWRFAMAAQRDPVAAYQRFAQSYIHEQRYSSRPTPAEVSAEARRLLDVLLGRTGAQEILDNDTLQLHVLAVRCRGLLQGEGKGLWTGLVALGLANAVSRRALGLGVRRTLFAHPRSDENLLPKLNGFGLCRYTLREDNLRAALLASGSIPLVMEPEHDIPGADPGVYRDGGIIDYHVAADYRAGEGLVLFPHYDRQIVPGWFDKHLPWRRLRRGPVDTVLLVTPSPEFIASLPHGRIPDRRDFARYRGDDLGRRRAWQQVSDQSRRLAERFYDLCTRGRIADVVKPL